jgi:hypothetical protein
MALFITINIAIPFHISAQSELKDIPIFLGRMAFNEGKNRGFDGQQYVTWKTDDLAFAITGTFSGTFETQYSGPPVTYPVILDVLFVQVQAEYVYQPHGDLSFEPLTEVMPVVAENSTAETALFTVAGRFSVTDIMRSSSGLPLQKIWLNLTWVRVYDAEGGKGFHIFAGDADRYYPDIPQLGFDKEAEALSGRFGYYKILQGRGYKKRNVYDYQKWIRRYLRNRYR